MELMFDDILVILLVLLGILTALILFKNAYDRKKAGRYKAATSFSMLALAFISLAVAHLNESSLVEIPYHFFIAFMGLFILFLFIFVSIGLNLEKYTIYIVVIYVLSIGGLMSTPFPVAYAIIYTLMDIVGIITILIFIYMYLRIHSFGPFGFSIGLAIFLFLASFIHTGVIPTSHEVALRFHLASFALIFAASIFGAEKSILKGLANFIGIVLLIFGLAHSFYSIGLSMSIDYVLIFFGLGVSGLGLAVLVGTFVKKYQNTGDTISYTMALGMMFLLLYHMLLIEYLTVITFGEPPFILTLLIKFGYAKLLVITGIVILLYSLIRIYEKPMLNNLLVAYYTASIIYVAFFSDPSLGLIYYVAIFIIDAVTTMLPAFIFIYYGLRLLLSRIFGGGIPLSIGIGLLLYSLTNAAIMAFNNYLIAAILSLTLGIILILGNGGYLDKMLIRFLKKGGV